eukprot:SAG31_NODE_25081_length_468_cov_0.951220_2_plen_86_part_01
MHTNYGTNYSPDSPQQDCRTLLRYQNLVPAHILISIDTFRYVAWYMYHLDRGALHVQIMHGTNPVRPAPRPPAGIAYSSTVDLARC